MGTRAITEVFNKKGLIATIYRQMDGYPSEHGVAIAKVLEGRTLTNGIRGDRKKHFNGMGCFAALLVAALKADGEAGNIYLIGPLTNSDDYESYNYEIHGNDFAPENGVTIKVTNYNRDPLFEGDPEQFAAWCVKEDED